MTPRRANAGTEQVDLQPNHSKTPEYVKVESAIQAITFTRFWSKRGELSKKYFVKGGKIQKEAAAQMTTGIAERITCPFAELADLFSRANEFTAFGWGIHPGDRDTMHIITAEAKKQAPGNPAEIARTKENFVYPVGPGVIMFDHDSCEYGPTLTPDEFIAILGELYPPILTAARIVKGSVSAGVHMIGGQPQPGKGFHIYMPVQNAADIARFAALLESLTWAHGHGFIALAKNGAMLERTIFDTAVFSPERLDFVGKPVIEGDGLEYTPVPVDYTPGDMLDTAGLAGACPDTGAPKKAARTKVQAQADALRATYKKIKIEEMVEAGAVYDDAVQQIEAHFAGGCKELPASWPLYFDEFGKVTVGEACADSSKYDGATLRDPLDGLDGAPNKAKFFANTGNPIIHSFRHGGQNFSLRSTGADADEEVKQPWKLKLLDHVKKWNKTHASVMVGGKHRIMVEVVLDGRVIYEFFARAELSRLYDNTIIRVGEKMYANHLMAWAKHRASRVYTGGVIFRPGRVMPDHYFNTWRGFAVEPAQDDDLLHLIDQHIRTVVCGDIPELHAYLTKWIAYTIQNPGEPAGAAIVLRGAKGAGKSTLGHFLRAIWGVHGIHIANSRFLVGNFNSHLADVCFLFADEAFYSGDKQHEGVLKALVTEPTIMVERKGVDALPQYNCLKILMATNSDFAVPASRDERRYCVLDVSGARIGDRDYFAALQQDIRNPDVQAAFLFRALNTDLTDFHSGNIPDSIGLRDQRYHSMDSVQKWIVDCLVRGSFENVGTDNHFWQDQMTSNDLYVRYLSYCDANKLGEYHRLSQTKMGTYLGRVYQSIKDVGRSGLRGYYFGSVDAAVIAFERFEKVKLRELGGL